MSQNPLAIGLLLLTVFIAVALILNAATRGVGARKKDESGFEVVEQSGGMGLGIIRIAEWAAILVVIGFTIAGAFSSAVFSYVFSSAVATLSNEGLLPRNPQATVAISAIVGAATGFLSGALLTAPVFALSAIEKNTRRSAALLERLARPRT
jgi:hypothetical protein